LPAGTQGVAYSQTITASGGSSPYSFLVTSGALPSGLTLSSGGLLSGTPSVSGPSFNFTIQATDTNSCTGSRAYTLSISPSSCPPPPAPTLSADPGTVRLGQAVTLSWSGTIAAGQGSYRVEVSINGGAFFTVGTVSASGASSETFGYAASTVAGSYDFRVLAVPACGPSSSTASNVVRVIVTAPCSIAPAVTGVAVNPQTTVSSGTFTLTWNAAGSSGSYAVFRSTDGGQTFQLLTTTSATSFTGTATDPPGTTVTFEVEVQGCVYSTKSNFATLTVVSSACDPPGPVSNVQIRPLGGDLSRGPAPTEFFVVSWSAPAGGTPPTRFGLRINGEPEVSVAGTSVTLLPRGTKLDPIQAFVKAFGCVPEKAGPETAGDPVALFLTPPKAQFSVSSNARANVPVVFTDTSSPQATSWLWIFDDGTTDSRQSPTHTFAIPGPHVIFLIASNAAGSSQTSQSISVGAAGTAVVLATSVVPIDSTDPARRRARVEILERETVLLRLQTQGSGEAIVFLRFLDSTGAAVLERRLSVRPGAETVHDLGAFGIGGTYTIELVSSQDFEPVLTLAGRPGVREVSR
jgi:PKD repeat protein